jgi:uncharacterized protein YndB with AHSA1/START domain
MKNPIIISSQINAPISKVWEMWTMPSHICRWNFATPEWCCPSCKNDLVLGGKLESRMEAKDGSFGFDFWCTYNDIQVEKNLALTMGDGRKWLVEFESNADGTLVTEHFEPESENPREMQEGGWQAILNNFKAYVESKPFQKLTYTVNIDKPKDHVFHTMLAPSSYAEWTSVFTPSSHYDGEWKEGAKMRFLATDADGKLNGMLSKIWKVVPNEMVVIEHHGDIINNEEMTTGEFIDQWSGALEKYFYEDNGSGTTLKVELDSVPAFFSFFEEQYPKALLKLKEVCER